MGSMTCLMPKFEGFQIWIFPFTFSTPWLSFRTINKWVSLLYFLAWMSIVMLPNFVHTTCSWVLSRVVSFATIPRLLSNELASSLTFNLHLFHFKHRIWTLFFYFFHNHTALYFIQIWLLQIFIKKEPITSDLLLIRYTYNLLE